MWNDGVINRGNHNVIINRSNVTAAPSATRRPGRWHVGVITVISAEMRAVLDVLGPTHETTLGGRRFHESRLDVDGTPIGVVTTRTIGPGQRQAGAAYQHLRAAYAPPVVVLVGIAGGVHQAVSLGDVVVATRVVYYDARREDPGETLYRGESHDLPPAMQHSVNAYFTRYGEPAQLRRPAGRRDATFRALPGPIGSGEAVIRDENNQARRWLRAFNDKILATETEAAALAHAFHEDRDADAPPYGWLVGRGISDHANPEKNDAHHDAASRNAAHVFRTLLPYVVSADAWARR